MAPFDAIPEPPPTESAGGSGAGAESAAKAGKFAIKWNSPVTLLALVLVLGFGQSLALLVFFGGRGDDLNASHDSAAAHDESHPNASDPHAAPDDHAASEAASDAAPPYTDHADPHENHGEGEVAGDAHAEADPATTGAESGTTAPAIPQKPIRTPDVLDTARDMLDRGDVSGARRIATAYLLRLDGMNAAARERASAAYAILGDAMRLDYELSLRLRGDGE